MLWLTVPIYVHVVIISFVFLVQVLVEAQAHTTLPGDPPLLPGELLSYIGKLKEKRLIFSLQINPRKGIMTHAIMYM